MVSSTEPEFPGSSASLAAMPVPHPWAGAEARLTADSGRQRRVHRPGKKCRADYSCPVHSLGNAGLDVAEHVAEQFCSAMSWVQRLARTATGSARCANLR